MTTPYCISIAVFIIMKWLNISTNHGEFETVPNLKGKSIEVANIELKENNLEKIAFDIEFPLVPVLEEMEREGVGLDEEALRSMSKDLELLMINYTREIIKLAGVEFNVNSTKQLQEILFEKLLLPRTKKTKTNHLVKTSYLCVKFLKWEP